MPACGRTPSPRWSRRARGASRARAPEPECRSVEIDAKGRTLLMRSDCPVEEGGAGATTARADHHGLDDLRGQIRSRRRDPEPGVGRGPGGEAGHGPRDHGLCRALPRGRRDPPALPLCGLVRPDAGGVPAGRCGACRLRGTAQGGFAPIRPLRMVHPPFPQHGRCRPPGLGPPLAGRRQSGCPGATRRDRWKPPGRREARPPDAPVDPAEQSRPRRQRQLPGHWPGGVGNPPGDGR